MKDDIRFVKTAPRKVRITAGAEGVAEVRELIAPAEYAVKKGEEVLLRIVKTSDGWRACRPTPNSRIGLAVSPIGVDTWGAVRAWSLKEFAT